MPVVYNLLRSVIESCIVVSDTHHVSYVRKGCVRYLVGFLQGESAGSELTILSKLLFKIPYLFRDRHERH